MTSLLGITIKSFFFFSLNIYKLRVEKKKPEEINNFSEPNFWMDSFKNYNTLLLLPFIFSHFGAIFWPGLKKRCKKFREKRDERKINER